MQQDPTNAEFEDEDEFEDEFEDEDELESTSVATDAETDHPSRPVSARQLAANRRNAQKSTGPTSAAGKLRSSRNRINHGMYGDIRPIEHGEFREDPLAVQRTLDDVIEGLQPRNGMERASAVRVANVMIQIGRYHAFETVNLTSMTSVAESNLVGPGVFEAQYNAEMFAELAEVLLREPETYTHGDWHDLLLCIATFDTDIVELYRLLNLDDPARLDESKDLILANIRRHFGEPGEEASRTCAEFARMESERLPDATADFHRAASGIGWMLKNQTLEVHSKILGRLSAALDRELKRYKGLREWTDTQTAAADDAAENTGDDDAA